MSIVTNHRDSGEIWFTEHKCKREIAEQWVGHGRAIDAIIYYHEKKTWFADNGEYGTGITYCPFCGLKLPSIKYNDP